MSFTEEEFERLEREIAALFLPRHPSDDSGAPSERIDRILDRVQETEDAPGGSPDGGEEEGLAHGDGPTE